MGLLLKKNILSWRESSLYFQSNPLCLEKLGFHIRWFHLNVNNVHYVHALPKGNACIFSYIRRLCPFLAVQIFNFNIFGGFQKNEGVWRNCGFYFLGGGVHRRSSLFLGVISMHFRVLGYRMGTFLGEGKVSNIFWVCLIFMILFYWVGDG